MYVEEFENGMKVSIFDSVYNKIENVLCIFKELRDYNHNFDILKNIKKQGFAYLIEENGSYYITDNIVNYIDLFEIDLREIEPFYDEQ